MLCGEQSCYSAMRNVKELLLSEPDVKYQLDGHERQSRFRKWRSPQGRQYSRSYPEGGVLIWVLRVNAVLADLLALLIIVRIVTQRLVFPRAVYIGSALLGFGGWVAYLFITGGTPLGREGQASLGWEQWLAVTPFILPLEAGFVGWLGIRSWWRWYMLGAGMVLSLAPFLVMLLLRVLG